MSGNVNIPPDIRAALERAYNKQLSKRFGDTPPTPEQELAFVEDLLNSGVRDVPLVDGTFVNVAAEGAADSPIEMENEARTAQSSGSNSRVRVIVGAVMLVIAAVIAIVMLAPGARGSSGSKGTPTPQGSLSLDISKLPTGIDALVSSGDTKSTLVLPRTLELTDGISTTTYIIVPVKVEQADWPCEAQKDKPVACWVLGTVVNYLVGIPSSDRSASVMARRIRERGGIARLRFSTERVMTFRAEVVDVERHQTEFLAQDHTGITIPLLGSNGANRIVILGEYEPETVGQPVVAAGRTGPDSGAPLQSVISMGQTARIGQVEIIPIGSMQQDLESRLTLRVHNLSNAPLALSSNAGWKANALLKSGASVSARIEGSGINPGDTAVVSLVASGATSAWRLSMGSNEITVTAP